MSRPDPQQLALDCQSAIDEGNWSRAEAGFKALAKVMPDSASIHDRLGLTSSRKAANGSACPTIAFYSCCRMKVALI